MSPSMLIRGRPHGSLSPMDRSMRKVGRERMLAVDVVLVGRAGSARSGDRGFGRTGHEVSPLLVSAADAAKLLGIASSTLYKLNACGRVPRHVRLGRRTLWRVAKLEDWVNAGCPARERWEVDREQSCDS